MEKTIKVTAWIFIVIGVLAVIGGMNDNDTAALFGGMLFAGYGAMNLSYIAENRKKIAKLKGLPVED